MNAGVQLNLALILFVPWYAILAVLFWVYPRQPKTAARRGFDLATLLVATIASTASMHWSVLSADRHYGALWPQILATSVSYGVFLAVMTAGWYARRRCITVPLATRLRTPSHSLDALQ